MAKSDPPINGSNECNVRVNIISWNIKGANHVIKRNRVLSHLRTMDVNIAFLQETHLKNTDHNRLYKGWVGQVYHSYYQDRSRGLLSLLIKTHHSLYKIFMQIIKVDQ